MFQNFWLGRERSVRAFSPDYEFYLQYDAGLDCSEVARYKPASRSWGVGCGKKTVLATRLAPESDLHHISGCGHTGSAFDVKVACDDKNCSATALAESSGGTQLFRNAVLNLGQFDCNGEQDALSPIHGADESCRRSADRAVDSLLAIWNWQLCVRAVAGWLRILLLALASRRREIAAHDLAAIYVPFGEPLVIFW